MHCYNINYIIYIIHFLCSFFYLRKIYKHFASTKIGKPHKYWLPEEYTLFKLNALYYISYPIYKFITIYSIVSTHYSLILYGFESFWRHFSDIASLSVNPIKIRFFDYFLKIYFPLPLPETGSTISNAQLESFS